MNKCSQVKCPTECQNKVNIDQIQNGLSDDWFGFEEVDNVYGDQGVEDN